MLDHAALLVRSIEGTLARLGQVDADRGPIEEFPGEGTRELYLGPPGRPGRLLLIEPLGQDGPYARALRKRGPGLHHAAFATASIDAFLSENPGWLLHPISLRTRDTSATVWLARPGIALLLEVTELPSDQRSPPTQSPLVSRLSTPAAKGLEPLLERLGLAPGPPAINIAGSSFAINDLVASPGG